MNRIFHNSEIKHLLKSELNKVESKITVISAYVKLEALKYLDEILSPVEEKLLVVRFQKNDIAAGSSDLEIYSYCKNHGWKIYINNNLHSKIIMLDDARIIVGSANLTPSGIGLHSRQNIESVVIVDATKAEVDDVNEILDSATEMNDTIFELMNYEMKGVQIGASNIIYKWSEELLSQLANNDEIYDLWLDDFYISIAIGSTEISYEKNKQIIDHNKKIFLQSKALKWLKLVVKDEMTFGELTEKLHEAVLDDPKPYRSEIKKRVELLFDLIRLLNIEDFDINQINYTHIIKRK